jgi:hypothetical protein
MLDIDNGIRYEIRMAIDEVRVLWVGLLCSLSLAGAGTDQCLLEGRDGLGHWHTTQIRQASCWLKLDLRLHACIPWHVIVTPLIRQGSPEAALWAAH